MSSASYYKPSGEFSPVGVALLFVIALPAAAMLAVVYAYSILYIPIAGYVSFILSAGFGVLVGMVTSARLRSGKVRNDGLAWISATLIALLAFYVHWGVWTYGFLTRADVETSVIGLLLSPSALWDIILSINEQGAWTMKGNTPTGGWLWAFWTLEALLILVPAIVVGAISASDPFCERCKEWCKEHDDVLRLQPQDEAQVKSKAEAKDFHGLAQLGGAGADAAHYLRLDLTQCPTCDQTSTLTIQDVTVSVDKEGKHSESKSHFVSNLLLSASELAQVRALRPAMPAAEPGPEAASVPA